MHNEISSDKRLFVLTGVRMKRLNQPPALEFLCAKKLKLEDQSP